MKSDMPHAYMFIAVQLEGFNGYAIIQVSCLSEIYVNSVCDHVKLKFVWVCSFWRVLDLVAWVRA